MSTKVETTATGPAMLHYMTKSRAFACPKCDQPSSSEVLGRATAYNDDWDIPTEFVFLQCRECLNPLVQWREDYGEGFDADVATFMYPQPRRLSFEIPRALRDGFEDARKCFDAKVYTATLVMVRRTLEATCHDQGATKRNLAANLTDLRSQGKIDGLLAEWADLLRVVGNEGAHPGPGTVTRQDAEDALDFAEALLDHIYVLRRRFKKFKKRRPNHRA